MSAEKTEALRLAEDLEIDYFGDVVAHDAADELRRLHASCEDYAQHKQRQDQRVLELAERVLELKAQRDALLAALKWLDKWMSDKTIPECVWKVRAAIKRAEGEGA